MRTAAQQKAPPLSFPNFPAFYCRIMSVNAPPDGTPHKDGAIYQTDELFSRKYRPRNPDIVPRKCQTIISR
jgi:hypothetical protein